MCLSDGFNALGGKWLSGHRPPWRTTGLRSAVPVAKAQTHVDWCIRFAIARLGREKREPVAVSNLRVTERRLPRFLVRPFPVCATGVG